MERHLLTFADDTSHRMFTMSDSLVGGSHTGIKLKFVVRDSSWSMIALHGLHRKYPNRSRKYYQWHTLFWRNLMSQATEATIQLLPGLMQQRRGWYWLVALILLLWVMHHPKFGLEKNIISPRGATGGVVNAWRRCSRAIFDRDGHQNCSFFDSN